MKFRKQTTFDLLVPADAALDADLVDNCTEETDHAKHEEAQDIIERVWIFDKEGGDDHGDVDKTDNEPDPSFIPGLRPSPDQGHGQCGINASTKAVTEGDGVIKDVTHLHSPLEEDVATEDCQDNQEADPLGELVSDNLTEGVLGHQCQSRRSFLGKSRERIRFIKAQDFFFFILID